MTEWQFIGSVAADAIGAAIAAIGFSVISNPPRRVIPCTAILAAIGGGQLHSNTLHGSLGGVDFAKLSLAAQQIVPCGNVVGRGLAELVVPQSP